MPMMRITIVTVNYRTPDLALASARALVAERARRPDLRMVIADNASPDESLARLKHGLAEPELADWVTVLPLALNGGFGWGNNQAILHLVQQGDPPDAILLLNPDAQMAPGALGLMAQRMASDARIGAVGAQLLDDTGRRAASAFRFPSIRREFVRGASTARLARLLGTSPGLVESPVACPVDWVTGAAVLIRWAALAEAGLFDTGFFLYFEEVELMNRLNRAGWTIWTEPGAQVHHLSGAATGVDGSNTARPLPDYWYVARQRCLVRTLGPARAWCANRAWFLGQHLFHLRQRFNLGVGGGPAAAGEAKAIQAAGLKARARDHPGGVARLTDNPGQPPLWMRDRSA